MATVFYGSDTVCVTDLPLIDVQISDPVQLIGQRLVRRLTTPTGALALIGDVPDGLDVRQYVNKKLAPGAVAQAQQNIRSEVLKEQTISSATVQMSPNNGNWIITIQGIGGFGPFSLTLNVEQLTVSAVFSF